MKKIFNYMLIMLSVMIIPINKAWGQEDNIYCYGTLPFKKYYLNTEETNIVVSSNAKLYEVKYDISKNYLSITDNAITLSQNQSYQFIQYYNLTNPIGFDSYIILDITTYKYYLVNSMSVVNNSNLAERNQRIINGYKFYTDLVSLTDIENKNSDERMALLFSINQIIEEFYDFIKKDIILLSQDLDETMAQVAQTLLDKEPNETNSSQLDYKLNQLVWMNISAKILWEFIKTEKFYKIG